MSEKKNPTIGITTSNGETKLFYINFHLFGKTLSISFSGMVKYTIMIITIAWSLYKYIVPYFNDWTELKEDVKLVKTQVTYLSKNDSTTQKFIENEIKKDELQRLLDSALKSQQDISEEGYENKSKINKPHQYSNYELYNALRDLLKSGGNKQ